MNKIKAFWRVLMILGILIFGLIVVWFVVKITVGEYKGTNSQLEQEDILANSESGVVRVVNQDSIGINNIDGVSKDLQFTDETKFYVMDPRNGEYVIVSKDQIIPGTSVYIELGQDNSEIVKAVKAQQNTVFGGIVKSVDGQNIYIEDNMNVYREILISDSTVIYLSGGEEKNISDIVPGSSLMIYSSRPVTEGVILEAGWVEIIDMSKYEVEVIEE